MHQVELLQNPSLPLRGRFMHLETMLTEKACAPLIAIVPTAEMNVRLFLSRWSCTQWTWCLWFSLGWGTVVPRCHWLCGTIGHLPSWKLAWRLLVPWKLVPRKEDFRADPAQVLRALCLKCMVSSALGTYLPHLVGKSKDNSSWESLEQSRPTTEKIAAYVCLVLGFFLGLWLFEGALSAQMGNLYLNHIWNL